MLVKSAAFEVPSPEILIQEMLRCIPVCFEQAPPGGGGKLSINQTLRIVIEHKDPSLE